MGPCTYRWLRTSAERVNVCNCLRLNHLKREVNNYPLYTALLSCSRWIGNPTNHSSTTVSVIPSWLNERAFNNMRFSESNLQR